MLPRKSMGFPQAAALGVQKVGSKGLTLGLSSTLFRLAFSLWLHWFYCRYQSTHDTSHSSFRISIAFGRNVT